jgi:Domain of unknown function (DUF4153)
LGKDTVNRLLKRFTRFACFLPLPLVLIASYALTLRVAGHGWTSDRIIAACCLVVATCYAIGYAFAALSRRDWLSAIARVNVATAFVMLFFWLALFSPVLDPARLSVSHQLSRLAAGKVLAKDFDFKYLRFEGRRFGVDALKGLAEQSSGADAQVLRESAKQALSMKYMWNSEIKPAAKELAANLTVWPKPLEAPKSFLEQDWTKAPMQWNLPKCLVNRSYRCDLFIVDLDGDKKDELMVFDQLDPTGGNAKIFEQRLDGTWVAIGTFSNRLARCPDPMKNLKEGKFELAPPRWRNMVIDGKTFAFVPNDAYESNCSR